MEVYIIMTNKIFPPALKKALLPLYTCLFLISMTYTKQDDSIAYNTKQAITNEQKKTKRRPKRLGNLNYPIDQWFEKKVDGYFAKSKTLAQDKLKSDRFAVKELLYALERVESCSSPGQFIALLERLRSAYDEKERDGHEASSVENNLLDQVRCALLLKISATISASAREAILDVLYTTDNYLTYWYDQHNHTTRYFFHKSPHKWFIGKKQEDEIDDNIQLLQKVQEKHYRILGLLTAHLNTFEGMANVSDHYAWLDQLFSIINNVLVAQKRTDSSSADQFCRLAKTMQHYLGKLPEHYNQVMTTIVPAKKPNHFVRNWIAYSTLLTSTLLARNYWNRHWKDPKHWIGENKINGYKESLQDYWQEYCVDPIGDTWKVLFGKGNKKQAKNQSNKAVEQKHKLPNKRKIKDDIASQQAFVKELSAGMDADMQKLASDMTAKIMKKTDINSTRKEMKHFFKKEVKEKYIPAEEVPGILTAEKEGNIALFQDYVNRMPKHTIGNFIQRDHVVNAFFIFAQLKMFHLGVNAASALGQILDVYVKDINEKLSNVMIHVIMTLANVNGKLLDLDKLKKQLRVTLNFAALIPAIAAGWVVYKGTSSAYHWLTKRDYASIRHALAQVNAILIESANNFNDTVYGELIYLLHKLKLKAMRYVSRKNNMRQEFCNDIVKLESQDFSVEQKRAIIQNMRAHYPFLLPTV